MADLPMVFNHWLINRWDNIFLISIFFVYDIIILSIGWNVCPYTERPNFRSTLVLLYTIIWYKNMQLYFPFI